MLSASTAAVAPRGRDLARAGAAAIGALFLVLTAVSLDLSHQRFWAALVFPALFLFAATLAAPSAGILATLALVPIVPILGNLVAGPWVAPAEAALLVCGAGILLSAAPFADARSTPLRNALAIAAAAAAVGGVAATLAALPAWALPGALASLARRLYGVGPQEAMAPLRAAALHALPLAAYCLVRRLAPRERKRALVLFVASLALAAAWALAEAAGGPHLWPQAAYDRFARFGRAVGTVGDHNASAALFLVFLFPAAGYAAERRGLARAAGVAATALLAAGLLVTGSRTAWLFAVVGAAAVWLRGFSARRTLRALALAGGAVAFLAAAALLLPGGSGSVLRDRLASLAPSSAVGAVRSGRVPFWRTGAAIVVAHPLAGAGPGRVPAVFSSFRPPGFPVESENVHSWPLQCLAENGLPGGLLLLLPFAVLVPLLVRGARVLRGPEAGLVPGLAAAAAAGLVSHPFLLAQVQVVFWGAAALLERAVDEAAPVEGRGSPVVRLAPLALLVAWGLPRLVLAPGSEAGRWGYGAWGFAEGQGIYEWIAPEAALFESLPPAGSPLRISVRRPEPDAATEGMEVAARAGFGPWSGVRLVDTGWTSLTLRAGVAGPEGILVELRASRAVCPASSGSADRRILSVQLAKP